MRSYEVLIVDDEPGDVELTKLALMEAGYPCNVTVANNGREALARLQNNATPVTKPDLVFLDINMPQMNGKEFLKALRADPSLAGIPVVMLTTSDVERDVVSSYELGASGYLTKPVDMDELFSSIKRVQDYWFRVVRRPERTH